MINWMEDEIKKAKQISEVDTVVGSSKQRMRSEYRESPQIELTVRCDLALT